MKSTLSIVFILVCGWLSAQAEVIKVASCSMLSGPQASMGEMVKLGVQLAIEEAQPRFREKGFDLQFTPQDDQAMPDVGVAVARRLVNDPDVLAVVGHFNSGVSIPASEVYKDGNLVMVSPGSTNPRVTERGLKNVNRVCGRDDVQGPVGAEFAVNDLKAKRILVIHDKTAYGQGIAQAFRERVVALGGEIVGFIGTEEKTNFQSLILQMRALKPDLVYFGGIYDQGGVLLKQMRERRIDAIFMGPDGLDSSAFVDIAQNAAAGAYYTSVAGPVDKYPAAKEFAERFTARFGRPPEAFALYAYDAARVILAGIEAAIDQNGGRRPSRAQISEAVRNVNIDGITGPIAFNQNGDRVSADYWVIHFAEAKYPGTPVKSISSAPPTAN
ncbi:MAG: branched-chain amino acid ABC transporter substrate-binding protein [Kiritimatiellae bacterium]|nr:branched-chain amino acid ABC transporter substrate-binding protein [Kiritimatiellia bacterium]MDW8459424.1 branched-chain amino acid ABC transporter substrate-binding protein [Verrucomicrobiota bacterium]